MATRLNSIRVPVNFGAVADLVTTTLTALGSPTIYIPENSVTNPVTFTSVMLYICAQDVSTATGGSISLFTGQVQLAGAGAPATAAIAGATLANTGENWGGMMGPMDFTSHFTTNFGTVKSLAAAVSATITISTGTGTGIRGVYAYFEITYTYNDAEATRIATVCIPYESGTSTLTTVANTTFCTIPQLTGAGGWLNGYNTPTVRHRWIEVEGNCNNNNTATNHGMVLRFDAGANVTLPVRVSSLASGSYQKYLVDASANTTTATHTFQIWETLATRFANLVVNEWVSYEYTVASTTEALNYIEIPFEINSPVAGTTNTVAHRFTRQISIPEPTTITMRNCAVQVFYNTTASATANILMGSQANRAYAMAASTTGGAGCYSFQHRFDSGSASGAGITLARGVQTLVFDLYRSAGSMVNVTGVIKILYSSGIASTGIDTHTKTYNLLLRQMNFTTVTDDITTTGAFAIPETNYWLRSARIQYYLWSPSALMNLMTQARVQAGEAAGSGWRTEFEDVYIGNTELGYTEWSVRLLDDFKRYPNDTDSTRMDIETSRIFRTSFSTASSIGAKWVVAYHSITSTVSGTISGSAGGTVTIDIYSANSPDELFDTTTRSGNGAYSFTVYDDTLKYYVVAYETATYKGTSKQGTPATNFDISLSGGGAVTTGYAGG